MGMIVVRQNCIHEEIKIILNPRNTCYRSIQNLSKNVSKTLNFYRCGTWLLTLREEHRLKVFENEVLRRILWQKRGGNWKIKNTEDFHNLYS
jgi:hypothetical protein